jgi:hypothetical protein
MMLLFCPALRLARTAQPGHPASRSLCRRQHPPRPVPSQPGRRPPDRHRWPGPQADYASHGGEYLDDALRFADVMTGSERFAARGPAQER